MKSKLFLRVFMLMIILLSIFKELPYVRAAHELEPDIPMEMAQELLAQMTPEERVGQLFLVSFTGSGSDLDSRVGELIKTYHIGGVVLLAQNDNFTEAPVTVASAYQLIASLQNIEWATSIESIQGVDSTSVDTTYIPLFIGISQDGDGYPYDQLLSGLTTLPGLMSVGATWDPDLAEQTGEVAGQELSRVGFNLFFGPSLDVLEYPSTTTPTGLGSTVFGGDPYWVGRMGESYIGGIHSGSGGKIAVIAKHFPGRGSADRPSGDEVATVRKSLEQLKQIELAPFFAVTGDSSSHNGMADGLLVSHIRYQGFQGNIRSTTRPVSFDSQALAQILSLPAFTAWRENGGVMVSDDLGSNTVKLFYDPTGTSFSAKLVARDAFLAGNDLLYLGNIISSDQQDTHGTVIQIVEYFTQKYQEDPTFAQRVDNSVLRILTLKYRIYSNFAIEDVIPDQAGLSQLGSSDNITFYVAGRSATLISPDSNDLAAILPEPPGERDHIVFLTDSNSQQQCSTCMQKTSMDVDALQRAVLRLYGPLGAGLVYSNRMVSYEVSDLASALQEDGGESTVAYDLRIADWIVISLVDPGVGENNSILRRFLSERQDLLREKTIIVFAFNAPYYLDATDISKITAYYGLFSKSEPFVEMAARILFQEVDPTGALPVSVPGIGYDLLSEMAPDPNQVIELALDVSSTPSLTDPQGTSVPPTPIVRVGDTINVVTSIIVDHNGHQVPDGTGVNFIMSQSGNNDLIQQVDSSTVDGVSKAAFNIDRSGLLEIRATSDPALTSVVLQIEITSDGLSVTSLPPTQIPEEATPTAVLISTPHSESTLGSTGRPGFTGWLYMVLFLLGIGGLAFLTGRKAYNTQWGIRLSLCVTLGGAIAYSYISFGLPGASDVLMRYDFFGILGIVGLGVVAGLAAGLLWMYIQTRQKKIS